MNLSRLLPSVYTNPKNPFSIIRPHLLSASRSVEGFWSNLRWECLGVNRPLCKMLRFPEDALLGWRKETVFDIKDDFHTPARMSGMKYLALKPKPRVSAVLLNTLRYKTGDGLIVEALARTQNFSTDGNVVDFMLVSIDSYRYLPKEDPTRFVPVFDDRTEEVFNHYGQHQ